METLKLQPIKKVNGTINLPGSKSISNRVLLLAALSNNTMIISNLLDCLDVRYMLNVLKTFGIYYNLSKNRTYCTITGNYKVINNYYYKNKLFIGNSGITMRLLTGILSIGNKNIIITGDKNMKKRPIAHLVNALRQGGAKIDYIDRKYYPPLLIHGGFFGGKITIDCSISSQFLSALLITSPLAIQDTIISIKGNIVSKPYIDITLNIMKKFGINVINQEYQKFFIKGGQKYISPCNYTIEGDASSASYFLAAGAIKGGTVKVIGIDKYSIQGDIFFAKILEKMGAIITYGNNFITCTHNELNSIDIDINNIPDAAMTIAITALFAKGTTKLRNIYNWRVKETDRIIAMTTELRKIGAIVYEGDNYISITPPFKFKSAIINTYNDHRIAMCFSLIALSNNSIVIKNPNCTFKSFPDFFNKFASISI